ncbi:hypothetical protein JNUCC0626_24715 [Lentzea sp. JNUCC 0626]|uniref:hypothetical protein n=1 Tax=Lentzea sp. JNUCC 0626 TaxID=3367513 RepID=UPI003748C0F1
MNSTADGACRTTDGAGNPGSPANVLFCVNNKTVSALSLVVIVAVLVALHPSWREPPAINLAVPFAGTPAEQWPDGADGIVVPDDRPVFAQVRTALIASRTDPEMIERHNPEPFLEMLAPQVRDEVANNLPGWTTRIRSGVRLLGVKTSGRMTLSEHNGHPLVLTDYVFAYAFAPPDPSKLRHQREMVVASRNQVSYAVTPDGVWPAEARGFQYSVACGAAREGFLAPQFTEPARPGAGVAGDDRRYFSADGPLPDPDTCA